RGISLHKFRCGVNFTSHARVQRYEALSVTSARKAEKTLSKSWRERHIVTYLPENVVAGALCEVLKADAGRFGRIPFVLVVALDLSRQRATENLDQVLHRPLRVESAHMVRRPALLSRFFGFDHQVNLLFAHIRPEFYA